MGSRNKQLGFQRAFSAPSSSPTNRSWFREPNKNWSPKSDDSDYSLNSDEENHVAMETDCATTSANYNSSPINKTFTLNTFTLPSAVIPSINTISNQCVNQDTSSKSLLIGRPLRSVGLKDVDLTKNNRAEEIRRAKEANRSKDKMHIFTPVRQNSSPGILNGRHSQQQQATNRMIQKSPEEKFFPPLSGASTNYGSVQSKPDLSMVLYDSNTARNRIKTQPKSTLKLPKLYSRMIDEEDGDDKCCRDEIPSSDIEVIEIDDDIEIVSPSTIVFHDNITTRKPRKRFPKSQRLTSFSDEEDDDEKLKSASKLDDGGKCIDEKSSPKPSVKEVKYWPMFMGLLTILIIVAVILSIYFHINPHGLCLDSEFQYNITGLENDLKEVFYGQHLAMRVLLSSLRSRNRFTNKNKPLVLSLHGWTGTGKNYISGLIAKHIFKHGMNSKFIHKFIIPLHFPYVAEVDLYKRQLHNWILGNLTKCSKGALFIFDEMDKIPPGVVTVLKQFLDPKGTKADAMFRNVIFLFLSNAGRKLINGHVLNHYKKGLDRESIQLVTLEQLLHTYGEKNPDIWYHELLKSEVIDHYVPFLPLEWSHVKQCVREDMRSKGFVVLEKMVTEVANEMSYFPKDLQIFSVSGCKKVSSKVDVAMG